MTARARPPARERELRAAIKRSGLADGARMVYITLLDRADFVTAELPEQFQPRSLDVLAREAGLSRSKTVRMLDELERWGWVERKRARGRGHHTSYALLLGKSIVRAEPLSDAERARRYRERKAAQAASQKVSESVTLSPIKRLSSRDKTCQDHVTKHIKSRDGAPGQEPVSLRGSVRGEVKGEASQRETRVTGADLAMAPGSKPAAPVCGWCGSPRAECDCVGAAAERLAVDRLGGQVIDEEGWR